MATTLVDSGPWLSSKAAALYLGMKGPQAYRTLPKWVKSGRLRGEGVGKNGREYRFKKFALDAAIAIKAKRKRG